ncbi:MAG: T9SS C-terminal target domain-containing protein [Cytophagales bacterium]|nr:MAG: T9SS C-terminal target domain-containing protein [Cytophagales bacterium]
MKSKFYILFCFLAIIQIRVTQAQRNAISLDGVDDYVRMDNFMGGTPSTLPNNFTVEAWVNPTDVSNNNEIIELWSEQCSGMGGGKDRVEFRITDGQLQFGYYSNCALQFEASVGATVIGTGAWVHVAAVKSGNSVRLYIDGMLQTESYLFGRTSFTIAPIVKDMNIGGSVFYPFFDNGNRFNGQIDELRIWNTSRTQEQIRENMHLTQPTSATGLANYYQMNETSGDLIDVVGGKNGLLTSGAVRGTSTLSISTGQSKRLTISATGVADFTDASLKVNFATISPPVIAGNQDEFVAYRLDGKPCNDVGAPALATTSSYWILRKFGSQNFSYSQDIFTIPPPNNLSAEELVPSKLELYDRAVNTCSAWNTTGAANAVSNATKQATFNFAPASSRVGMFTIGTVISLLPVNLVYFYANRVSDQKVTFYWKTSSETQNKGFVVQASSDGINFTNVGFIEAKELSHSKGADYYFSHQNRFAAYYRLQQVDLDGTVWYSAMCFVKGENEGIDVVIYPNPFSEEVKLSINSALIGETEFASLQLCNSTGQVIWQRYDLIRNLSKEMNDALKEYSAGIYLLKIFIREQVIIKKILKKY